MIRFIFCIGLFFIQSFAFCQSDDAKEKEGYKVIYLDSIFDVCDSSDAFYFAYGYYEGRREITEVSFITIGISSDNVKYGGVLGKSGSPVVLNGTIQIKKGDTKFIRIFENGYPIRFEESEINNSDTVYYGARYYNVLYMEQSGSHYFEFKTKYYSYSGWFRDGRFGWEDYAEYDSRGLKYSNGKYPYFTGLVPPFIGVVGGLEGFRSPGYEIGLALNGGIDGDIFGGMQGIILTYKNRFDNSYYAISIEEGIYSPISFGVGYTYFSNGIDDTHSFRLVTGITLFHLQMLYSYNFYKNSKNQIAELYHHAFTLRFVLPVWRF